MPNIEPIHEFVFTDHALSEMAHVKSPKKM